MHSYVHITVRYSRTRGKFTYACVFVCINIIFMVSLKWSPSGHDNVAGLHYGKNLIEIFELQISKFNTKLSFMKTLNIAGIYRSFIRRMA